MQAPITIRRSQVSDAAALAALTRHPDVFPGLLQLPHANEEMWRQRLSDNMAPGKNDLSLVAERDGAVVGSAGLQSTGPAVRRRHVMSLGMMVAAEAQGQGVGTALMAALVDYADNWGQVLRLELTVYADNERAVRLYQRFGFEIEGRMKAYALRAGQYVDTLAMARLHPQPPTVR